MSRIDANLAISAADIIRPQALAEDHAVHQQVARSRAVSRSAPESLLTTEDPPASDDVRAAAEQVRQVVEAASGRELSFAVDDKTETLVFRFTGKDGLEVKQIPSKEVLELRDRIHALVGALFDKKA